MLDTGVQPNKIMEWAGKNNLFTNNRKGQHFIHIFINVLHHTGNNIGRDLMGYSCYLHVGTSGNVQDPDTGL